VAIVAAPLRLVQLLDGDLRQADVVDLALPLELGELPQRLRNRHLRVDAVELVELDPLQPEVTEAQLALLSQVLGATHRTPVARAGARQSSFGRDQEPLPIRMKRLMDQLLGHEWAVRVGGVDEVDAELDRSPQHPDRFVVIVWLATVASPPIANVPEAATGVVVRRFLSWSGRVAPS
jgi:hypothetical protein